MPLSYDQAVALALSENADLMTLRYQRESLGLRAAQALSPNNPVFSYLRNDATQFSPGAPAATEVYQVQFTLGFPGRALSQSATGRHQAEAAGEQARAKEIDILTALSVNFAALAANRKLHAFLTGEEKKASDLVRLLEKKFSAAQAAQVDLLNQRVVVAQLGQAILQNRNERSQLLTQFLNLIRKPGSSRFAPQVPEDVSVPDLKLSQEQLASLMLSHRHVLAAAHQQAEAARTALTTAYLSPLPDLQLTGAVNVWNVPSAAPNPGVNRDYSLGVGISVPIFLPLNEVSGIRAASKDRDAAEAQEESQRLQAMADLQTVYTSYVTTRKSIQNMVDLVLPASKASYDLTLLTYSLGKSDYFQLNQARSNWIQSQKDLLSAKLAAAQAYEQIVNQVGCDFTRTEGAYACH